MPARSSKLDHVPISAHPSLSSARPPALYYRGTPRHDIFTGSSGALLPLRTPSPSLLDSEIQEHPPSRWLRFSGALRRFWILELLWCFVGLGSAVAIVTVLDQHDGQKAPEWPLGVSLNTFLAFLVSLAKAALLMPVTEGLGQLRWIWFIKKARRAEDFELFDGATRGTFGSFRLLVSLKGGLLGFVATLVMVASLIISSPMVSRSPGSQRCRSRGTRIERARKKPVHSIPPPSSQGRPE